MDGSRSSSSGSTSHEPGTRERYLVSSPTSPSPPPSTIIPASSPTSTTPLALTLAPPAAATLSSPTPSTAASRCSTLQFNMVTRRPLPSFSQPSSLEMGGDEARTFHSSMMTPAFSSPNVIAAAQHPLLLTLPLSREIGAAGTRAFPSTRTAPTSAPMSTLPVPTSAPLMPTSKASLRKRYGKPTLSRRALLNSTAAASSSPTPQQRLPRLAIFAPPASGPAIAGDATKRKGQHQHGYIEEERGADGGRDGDGGIVPARSKRLRPSVEGGEDVGLRHDQKRRPVGQGSDVGHQQSSMKGKTDQRYVGVVGRAKERVSGSGATVTTSKVVPMSDERRVQLGFSPMKKREDQVTIEKERDVRTATMRTLPGIRHLDTSISGEMSRMMNVKDDVGRDTDHSPTRLSPGSLPVARQHAVTPLCNGNDSSWRYEAPNGGGYNGVKSDAPALQTSSGDATHGLKSCATSEMFSVTNLGMRLVPGAGRQSIGSISLPTTLSAKRAESIREHGQHVAGKRLPKTILNYPQLIKNPDGTRISGGEAGVGLTDCPLVDGSIIRKRDTAGMGWKSAAAEHEVQTGAHLVAIGSCPTNMNGTLVNKRDRGARMVAGERPGSTSLILTAYTPDWQISASGPARTNLDGKSQKQQRQQHKSEQGRRSYRMTTGRKGLRTAIAQKGLKRLPSSLQCSSMVATAISDENRMIPGNYKGILDANQNSRSRSQSSEAQSTSSSLSTIQRRNLAPLSYWTAEKFAIMTALKHWHPRPPTTLDEASRQPIVRTYRQNRVLLQLLTSTEEAQYGKKSVKTSRQDVRRIFRVRRQPLGNGRWGNEMDWWKNEEIVGDEVESGGTKEFSLAEILGTR